MKSLLQETLELRQRYDDEPSHSDHVASLALQIFDALRPELQLDERARELLQAAALLHDIGWSQTPDGRGHHRESARLIHEHNWFTLVAGDIALVAQIARYHRKSLPKPKHENFYKLPVEGQMLVLVLGGILRVADALDRTHAGRISGVSAKLANGAVIIQVQPTGDWEAELAMFQNKRDLLERALQRDVMCEAAAFAKRKL